MEMDGGYMMLDQDDFLEYVPEVFIDVPGMCERDSSELMAIAGRRTPRLNSWFALSRLLDLL